MAEVKSWQAPLWSKANPCNALRGIREKRKRRQCSLGTHCMPGILPKVTQQRSATWESGPWSARLSAQCSLHKPHCHPVGGQGKFTAKEGTVFYMLERTRISKSIQTERNCLTGTGFPFGVMTMFWNSRGGSMTL